MYSLNLLRDDLSVLLNLLYGDDCQLLGIGDVSLSSEYLVKHFWVSWWFPSRRMVEGKWKCWKLVSMSKTVYGKQKQHN